MFDEKYHDRGDAFGARLERLSKQMNPSHQLMKAAKTGVPLRTGGIRYTTGTHIRKFSKAILAYAAGVVILLGTILLLPRLFGEKTSVATQPKATTTATSPTTTTQTASQLYRPDLYWPSVTKFPVAGAWPVDNPVLYNVTTSETQLETPNFMVEIRATRYGDEMENLDITEYLVSRGWEILPDDAYQYIKWGSRDMTYAVAPSWKELAEFSVSDMLDYYEMDQSVMEDGGLVVYITQCMLKTM